MKKFSSSGSWDVLALTRASSIEQKPLSRETDLIQQVHLFVCMSGMEAAAYIAAIPRKVSAAAHSSQQEISRKRLR